MRVREFLSQDCSILHGYIDQSDCKFPSTLNCNILIPISVQNSLIYSGISQSFEKFSKKLFIVMCDLFTIALSRCYSTYSFLKKIENIYDSVAEPA